MWFLTTIAHLNCTVLLCTILQIWSFLPKKARLFECFLGGGELINNKLVMIRKASLFPLQAFQAYIQIQCLEIEFDN